MEIYAGTSFSLDIFSRASPTFLCTNNKMRTNENIPCLNQSLEEEINYTVQDKTKESSLIEESVWDLINKNSHTQASV